MVVLLEAAAEAVEHRQAASALPTGERAAWLDLGAEVDAERALPRSRATAAAAFARLVRASIGGDAAMAAALGVDRSRISQRLREHSLYSFAGPDDRYFPRWQLLGNRTLHGLKSVLGVLDPTLHPLTVDHWFNAASDELQVTRTARSPVEWLATGGDAARVRELAQDL